MLHGIHKKKGPPKASSLYCQWIPAERAGEKRLVAVWIDSEMRPFVGESETESTAELQADSLRGEPDLEARGV
jgi:hypothetical protein